MKRYGHGPVAAVQSTIDAALSTSSRKPLATRFAWQVMRTTGSWTAWWRAGPSPRWHARSAAVAAERILAGRDRRRPGRPRPQLTTVESVVECADNGWIPGWRGQIAIIAGNPWAPYPAELQRLLVDGGRAELADALDDVVKYYRDLAEQRDRQLVAREIRRLVAVSGLSQRQFAALCGTSAPRLSTYVNGLVTPSASMMVRLTRVSEREQQERGERGSSA